MIFFNRNIYHSKKFSSGISKKNTRKELINENSLTTYIIITTANIFKKKLLCLPEILTLNFGNRLFPHFGNTATKYNLMRMPLCSAYYGK